MSIATVRDGIITAIQAGMPDGSVREVSSHPGPFTLEEVKRYSKVSPAIVLAPLSGDSEDPTVTSSVLKAVKFGAYIIAVGRNRDAVSLSILDLAFPLIAMQPGVRKASFDNLFTSGSDDCSVSLWVITFSIVVRFTSPTSPVSLDEWNLMVTAWAPDHVPAPIDPDTDEPPALADATYESTDL